MGTGGTIGTGGSQPSGGCTMDANHPGYLHCGPWNVLEVKQERPSPKDYAWSLYPFFSQIPSLVPGQVANIVCGLTQDHGLTNCCADRTVDDASLPMLIAEAEEKKDAGVERNVCGMHPKGSAIRLVLRTPGKAMFSVGKVGTELGVWRRIEPKRGLQLPGLRNHIQRRQQKRKNAYRRARRADVPVYAVARADKRHRRKAGQSAGAKCSTPSPAPEKRPASFVSKSLVDPRESHPRISRSKLGAGGSDARRTVD